MPQGIAVQPDVLRRLVNAKLVMHRAVGFRNQSSDIDLSIALLLAHDAVELLMLAVLDHLAIAPQKNREFLSFWIEIKSPSPPDKGAMAALNKLRVNFKHYGILPHPTEVRELITRAVGFFENVLRLYCDLSYEDISLADLILDPAVRNQLNEARLKFLAGEKDAAMIDLQIALHRVEQPEGKFLPRLAAPEAPSLPNDLQRAGWGRYLDQLDVFLDQTATATNALIRGVDPFRYLDFVQAGPSIQWSVAGKPNVALTRTYRDLTIERFDQLSDFLIEYALRVSPAYVSSPTAPAS